MEPVQIRKTLGTFLFNGEDVFKKINVLSGGEKVRLGLCKIFKKNPNFLLLDEPTNHLDILGKENLEEILLNYNGSVLFVSHDRYFINKIADALLIFEKDQVIYFNGKYQDYLNQKDITKEKEIVINSPKIKKQVSKDNKNIIKKLENEINKMELAKKEIESEMLKEEIYTDYLKMNELQNKLNQLDEEIIIKMQEWENLNNE